MAEIPSCSQSNNPEKYCFQIKQELTESPNIYYCSENSKIIGWTEFKILLFSNFNFEYASQTFDPDFHIKQLTATNNYLVCLDRHGNVHTTSLKFKGAAQKRFKSCFQERDRGILHIHRDDENLLALKHVLGKYYLCVHKINTDYQLEKNLAVNIETEWVSSCKELDRYLLSSHLVALEYTKAMKKIMNVAETNWTDYRLVLISFDKLTLFCCLISTSMVNNEICLRKLHVCPTEICNVEVIEDDNFNVLISLTSGAVIKIPMNPNNMTPKVQHLNTALYKFKKISNKIFMYTDGVTLWKVEDLFSSDDIRITQYFVRQVKDFSKYGDNNIVCSTFSKFIYLFQYDDATTYVKKNDSFYKFETLLNNSEYLHKILEEVEKSNEIVKKVSKEGNLIAALTLCSRQDIVNNILQHEVVVYESYEDVLDKGSLTLTEPMEKYFESDLYLFLIRLSVCSFQQMFNEVIENLYTDLKLHISLSTENRTIKTTTVQIKEAFKKINILVPLSMKLVDVIQTIVDIRLSSNLSGPLDPKQMHWVPLYSKQTILNSEHFIRTNIQSRCMNLKENKNIDDLLLKAEMNLHGNLFVYKDANEAQSTHRDWTQYVKLPTNYMDLFTNESYCKEFITLSNVSFLLEQFKNEEFLRCRSSLILNIGYEKVNISIKNEFANLHLLVKSKNILVATHIRNFFANFIYSDFKSCRAGSEYIHNSFFQANENIRDKIKQKVEENCTLDQLMPVIDEFQKCIIGAMPI